MKVSQAKAEVLTYYTVSRDCYSPIRLFTFSLHVIIYHNAPGMSIGKGPVPKIGTGPGKLFSWDGFGKGDRNLNFAGWLIACHAACLFIDVHVNIASLNL